MKVAVIFCFLFGAACDFFHKVGLRFDLRRQGSVAGFSGFA